MPTGLAMLDLALTRVGQPYRNVLVPKNDPDWAGPWDCAEFASWLIFQTGGGLYGCTDPDGPPALTEAYTGAWKADAARRGRKVSVEIAAATPGAILLRYPPTAGRMGHIGVSDGRGKLVEAHSTAQGVTRHHDIAGRHWDTGVLIPGFDYETAAPIPIEKPRLLYRIGAKIMRVAVVKANQKALKTVGISPGVIDGAFGPNTAAAVAAFQVIRGLVVDGQVGAETAAALGVALK